MSTTPAAHLEGPVYSASSVEEATRAGLQDLGVDPADVDVRVIDRGWRGILGWRAREAKVALVPRVSYAPLVEELALGMLQHMHLEGTVKAVQSGLDVEVTVESPGADGLLIGRKGETLTAFEHLLHRMAARKTAGKVRDVRVDVSGYRQRRADELRREALALADRVRRSGRRAMTEPLEPAERRIVHRALAGISGVKSHVTGTGANRRVVVLPAEGPSPRP